MHRNQRTKFQWRWMLGILIVAIASPVILPEPSFPQPRWVAQQVSWGNIFSFLRRRRPGKGGKGGFCLLVPLAEKQAQNPPPILWSDRPLFIWRGLYPTIGLRKAGDKTVLWRESALQSDSVVKRLQYQGKALKPGSTYELLFFSSPTAKDPVRWQPFTVMPTPERTPITTHLQTLTTQLKQTRASEEAIAQRKAQYFVDRDLPADAWQAIYSMPTLSPDLQQQLANTVKEVCQEEKR